MPEALSQRDSRWKDKQLGFSTNTIEFYGCTISSLAMLLGTTPDIVNQKLKAVNGFSGAYIIWAKIPEAFPQVKSATRHWSYDNDIVVNNLPCMVEVDGSRIGASKHWVTYIGNQQMMDPWYGNIKSTKYYPPIGFTVIELDESYNPEEEKIYTEEEMTAMREQRDENWNLYQGEKAKANERKKIYEDFKAKLSEKLTLPTTSDEADIIGSMERALEAESQSNQKDKIITKLKEDYSRKEADWERKLSDIQQKLDDQAQEILDLKSEVEQVLLAHEELKSQKPDFTPSQSRFSRFLDKIIAWINK